MQRDPLASIPVLAGFAASAAMLGPSSSPTRAWVGRWCAKTSPPASSAPAEEGGGAGEDG